MTAFEEPEPLRIVAASLRAFDCSYPRYVENPPPLGAILAVREGPCVVFGVVVNVESGPEDPTRPLQPLGEPGQSAADVMRAHPHIRQLLRTRVRVVACGHATDGGPVPLLPPLPPPLLARVEPATPEETRALTAGGRFLPLLLAASECDDAVIGAAIRTARATFGDDGRSFLVEAGKELARLLRAEPARLTTILRMAV
ncbi:hypothetical protein HRbin29_01078 [bacterium HR29]|jgi:hypothetical protein|nr:hypothetical protein HRbin29_01078 [bacterium HR29]